MSTFFAADIFLLNFNKNCTSAVFFNSTCINAYSLAFFYNLPCIDTDCLVMCQGALQFSADLLALRQRELWFSIKDVK
jgi:hypothetical protein